MEVLKGHSEGEGQATYRKAAQGELPGEKSLRVPWLPLEGWERHVSNTHSGSKGPAWATRPGGAVACADVRGPGQSLQGTTGGPRLRDTQVALTYQDYLGFRSLPAGHVTAEREGSSHPTMWRVSFHGLVS